MNPMSSPNMSPAPWAQTHQQQSPMHQMPDGTMMPGAQHGQAPQQSSPQQLPWQAQQRVLPYNPFSGQGVDHMSPGGGGGPMQSPFQFGPSTQRQQMFGPQMQGQMSNIMQNLAQWYSPQAKSERNLNPFAGFSPDTMAAFRAQR